MSPAINGRSLSSFDKMKLIPEGTQNQKFSSGATLFEGAEGCRKPLFGR
jgi:hypothetical protein